MQKKLHRRYRSPESAPTVARNITPTPLSVATTRRIEKRNMLQDPRKMLQGNLHQHLPLLLASMTTLNSRHFHLRGKSKHRVLSRSRGTPRRRCNKQSPLGLHSQTNLTPVYMSSYMRISLSHQRLTLSLCPRTLLQPPALQETLPQPLPRPVKT